MIQIACTTWTVLFAFLPYLGLSHAVISCLAVWGSSKPSFTSSTLLAFTAIATASWGSSSFSSNLRHVPTRSTAKIPDVFFRGEVFGHPAVERYLFCICSMILSDLKESHMVHCCSLMFIDVHCCALMFIDVHWCSLMFIDVHCHYVDAVHCTKSFRGAVTSGKESFLTSSPTCHLISGGTVDQSWGKLRWRDWMPRIPRLILLATACCHKVKQHQNSARVLLSSKISGLVRSPGTIGGWRHLVNYWLAMRQYQHQCHFRLWSSHTTRLFLSGTPACIVAKARPSSINQMKLAQIHEASPTRHLQRCTPAGLHWRFWPHWGHKMQGTGTVPW